MDKIQTMNKFNIYPMKINTFIFLLVGIITISSCTRQYTKITGYWEASFDDSINFPKQILCFKIVKGNLTLTIDEPWDGTLAMPGENPDLVNDSLHYESLWGIFKYDGKFVGGDSVIKGIRVVNKSYSSPFVMRRISEKDLLYKIPRVDKKGERDYG